VSLNSIKLLMFPLARNFTLIAKYKLVRVTNLSVISQSNYNKFRAIWKIDIYVKYAPYLNIVKTKKHEPNIHTGYLHCTLTLKPEVFH